MRAVSCVMCGAEDAVTCPKHHPSAMPHDYCDSCFKKNWDRCPGCYPPPGQAPPLTEKVEDYEDYIPKGYHIVEDLDGERYVKNDTPPEGIE